jgi:hypothetical protein
MGDYSDIKQTERICNCPAGKKRLENVVNTLKGSTITEVSFSNCITTVGVNIKLNNNHEILIHLPCLSLDELMEDPEIRAQNIRNGGLHRNRIQNSLTQRAAALHNGARILSLV